MLIDDVKRDRETGDPGHWTFNDVGLDSTGEWFGCGVTLPSGFEMLWLEDDPETDTALARRIARLPELENALLAAEEVVRRLDADLRTKQSDFQEIFPELAAALAVYREATK